jgi:hypothetical protein
MEKAIIKSVLLLIIINITGCNMQYHSVKPYQKRYLSLNEMTFNINALEASINEHTFTSKETASGAYGAKGGGCGCN